MTSVNLSVLACPIMWTRFASVFYLLFPLVAINVFIEVFVCGAISTRMCRYLDKSLAMYVYNI